MNTAEYNLSILGKEEIIEILEILNRFEEILLLVEKADYMLSTIHFNELFRIIHSIKGLMSMYSRNEVHAIHELETELKYFENKTLISPVAFNKLLIGSKLLEESIRENKNENFLDKISTQLKSEDNSPHCIVVTHDPNWMLLDNISRLECDNVAIFFNIDDAYKIMGKLKNVKRIIISDNINNGEASSIIKVLNLIKKEAEILLIRERDKCSLYNVHDINFISCGIKDRNFENKLKNFLKKD